MSQFPGKGVVAVVKTSPATIFDDIQTVMKLAGFETALPKNVPTGDKNKYLLANLVPSVFFLPLAIRGVIRTLQNHGYTDLVGIHNDTVVVNTADAEQNNKHKFVTDKYNVPCLYLYNQEFEWLEYKPKKPFLVLDKVYPNGVFIPQALVGKNIVHLPTVKTHVFTTITGAMKNAFGGLLHRDRHWTHSVIHDTLVDLLMIQQDIHPGIFAVMDGTFAGDGPGPRAMRWHEKDILIASADQVAIDAVSAKLQGFNPMDIRFIRKAHEMELGIGDPHEIQIVGYDIEQEKPWSFVQEDTFASKGQKLIYHGPLKPFEKILLQSPLVPWSYFASNFYHNVYWYPFVGRQRVEAALQTKWGQMFKNYGNGEVVMPGMEPKTVVQAGAGLTAAAALMIGVGYLLRKRKMLRVEFHCHTQHSKDSLTRPEDLVKNCQRKGIERVIVTDHNTIRGAQEAHKIDPGRVIIGEEIMTRSGEILAAFVQEEIPEGLQAFEALQLLRQQNAFISISHPFDVLRGGHWKPSDLEDILPLVDAIETFNARCWSNRFNQQAENFARQHQIPGTVGSDAHTLIELGRATLRLPDFDNADDLRRVIGAGQPQVRLSGGWVHLASRYASWRKQYRP